MKVLRITGVALFALAMLVALSAPASAATYNFNCITINSVGDCAIGEAQLRMVVLQSGNLVNFTFYNDVPDGGSFSSLTHIFFDDTARGNYLGVLDGIQTIANQGISGNQQAPDFGAVQGNPALPGGGTLNPQFNVSAGLMADANPPPPANGVNELGESVMISFSLKGASTYSDVIAALNRGDLRVGLHVTAFASEGSEGFVNIVPEPGFYGLLSMGLAGLGFLAVRRRRSVGPQAE